MSDSPVSCTRRKFLRLTGRAAAAAVAGKFAAVPGGARAASPRSPDEPLRFVIPPSSRLARNEHPRCLLTAPRLARIQERLADPRLAREFANIQQRALGRRPWILEQALAYRLTGERRFLEALRQSAAFRRPTWVWGWAAALDLVWESLTVAERRALREAVVRAVAKGGSLYWRPTLHLVSVFYEGGQGPHDAFLRARLQRDFEETLVRWTDQLNRWAAGRGGSNMSHGYNGEHAYWEPLIAAICWTNATGRDYLTRAEFANYQSAFYWYHYVPEQPPLCVEHLGVTRDCADPGAIAPGHSGANNLAWLKITQLNDGLGVAWLNAVRAQEPAWARNQDAVGRLLWGDPDQPALDPTTLPRTRLFPTSGHVVMRGDWSPNATFATFRCGRFGEIDGAWGRNHADNLSFTIRKGGPLAIDSGPVHGQNTEVLKFYVKGVAGAVYEYGRQTIAHNSITIGEGEFTHRDWRGRPTADVVRCGGQSVRQAPHWWKAWGFAEPQKEFREGRIAAYRTHPYYDYALGDARWSYDPAAVEAITRQFIYLKPDVFVIYDRVRVARPETKPCWLLHSLREPRAFGSETPLTPAEIGPQRLQVAADRLIPHPHPGGHFRLSGSGFWVESGSPNRRGDGWLRVQTLVPGEADGERIKLGGRGHEFEVAGIQYGVRDEGYRMTDDPYAVRSTIGLAGWRVELRPRAPARTVEFLHVLQAGLGNRASARPATLRSDDTTHTVTVEHDNRRFVVTLRRAGPGGGDLAVTDVATGRTLCQDALPETVEDHYHFYRHHPHYRLWSTDPRYRVTIGPADAKG